MNNESLTREHIQDWCRENGEYELAHRISFVPDEVIEKLLFETVENVVKILESEGY